MPVDYLIDEDKVGWPQGPVLFHARGIRKERDKEHAEVTLAQDGRILDSDDINLKNREERNRLANSCWAMLTEEAKAAYPKDQMQHDLLLFCRDLYREYMKSGGAVRTKGAVTPTEPVFLLQDYILKDAGTILFAPPGRGKSWTGLLWAVAIDAGLQSPWVTLQSPVLFINLERSRESFERRLGQVNEALGLPRDRDLLMMHERGKSLSDIWDAADNTVAREGIGLTVIDSLSRAGTGSLVKDETANKAMDYANAFKSAWLFLAHTPRGDESHTFGSQMFDAAADLAVQLMTEEQAMDDLIGAPRLGIGIKVTKANDTAKPPLRIWTYEFSRQFGLERVVRAQAGEWPTIEGENGGRPPSQWDILVDEFRRHGPRSQKQLSEATGINKGSVSRLVSEAISKGLLSVASKNGREEFLQLQVASAQVAYNLQGNSQLPEGELPRATNHDEATNDGDEPW